MSGATAPSIARLAPTVPAGTTAGRRERGMQLLRRRSGVLGGEPDVMGLGRPPMGPGTRRKAEGLIAATVPHCHCVADFSPLDLVASSYSYSSALRYSQCVWRALYTMATSEWRVTTRITRLGAPPARSGVNSTHRWSPVPAACGRRRFRGTTGCLACSQGPLL